MSDKPVPPARGPEGPKGIVAAAASLAGTLGLAGVLGGAVVFAVTGQFSRWSWIPMAAGGGLFVLSLLASPRRVLAALRRRPARMGMNMAAMMVLVLGIAVLANYVGARRHHRFDFTRSKRHTLAPQTRKILKGLKKDVTLIAFYRRSGPYSQYGQMADLLERYRDGSTHLKARIVDPDVKPAEAEKYGASSGSVTVVESGDTRELAYGPSEQDLTTAILKVTREGKKTIYFLIGHGEHDPTAYGRAAYAAAKRALEAANYEVETLGLTGQRTIPKDCAVLIVGGPQKPLDPRESDAIAAYLRDGGRALLLLDPDPAPSLDDLLKTWGVEPLPGTVIEPELNMVGPSSVVIYRFLQHEITRPFMQGRQFSAAFYTPRALERIPEAGPDLHAADLLRTSGDSWIEPKFDPSVLPDRDEGDRRGPLTVMMAVSTGPPPLPPGMPPPPDQPAEKPVLVVIGDSDFAADAHLAEDANADLFLNSVNWLAGETDLVSITPRPEEEHTVMLDRVLARKTFVLCVLAVPLAVLVVGGAIWWRRR